jgi:hypothetical protein
MHICGVEAPLVVEKVPTGHATHDAVERPGAVEYVPGWHGWQVLELVAPVAVE